MRPAIICIAIAALSLATSATEVVLYTSLDKMHSEPVIASFEKETGIKVRSVFDTEANKTTGLVNRLLAEVKKPRADVFWNNEIVRTIVLKNKGVLTPYVSPNAAQIPATFKDKEGYWTGFAARARILIVNTDKVPESQRPASIFELTRPVWKDRICFANPLFGTTSTHAAALFAALGEDKALEYFVSLKGNGLAVLAGNATTKDRTAAGLYHVGFTDTDDANAALEAKEPVAMVFPDQDGMGTLLIPNTVAMVKGGPNPAEAKKLVDFILSPAVEERLAASSSVQIPLRPGLAGPANIPPTEKLTFMKVDFEQVAGQLENAMKKLEALLLD